MKNHLLLFIACCFCIPLLAQERAKEAIEEENGEETIVKYRELGAIGLGTTAFRDFATSPLIYRGLAASISGAKVKWKGQKEIRFATDVLLGYTNIVVGEQISSSILFGADLNYSRLYPLKSLSKKGWDYKVGGAVSVLVTNRVNTSLRNNLIGFDVFPTVFGSFKITKSFTRNPFLRRKRAAKRQQLSYQMDLGLLNTNLRNGYAYTTHAPFYNSVDVLSSYNFNWFSGFRMRTRIDYILYSNSTSNAIKISYKWDGTRTGTDPDRYALTNGILQFAFIHRLD